MASSGKCIVCGCETTDRKENGERKHWRCGDIDTCADRRDMRRRRPKNRSRDLDLALGTICTTREATGGC